MKKVMIGVTTYNRKALLNVMASSLYESDLGTDYSIRVYDDSSTEYSTSELREIFPDADRVIVNGINKGADLNTWGMYCDFLDSDCQFLFNADSDLLFSKRWLDYCRAAIDQTDGVLSLLNSAIHETISEDNDLLIKNVYGAAGTFFSRKRIEDLVKAADSGEFSPDRIDWGFCEFFAQKGLKLYCVKNSLVQHIGLKGFNSSNGGFCYGKGFSVDSIQNGQAINDVIEDFEETKCINGDIDGYYLFPFERVTRGARVVLYGSGMVGRDYIRQIDQTHYCDIVAVVDRSFDNRDVLPPESIIEMDFDTVVVATVKKEYIGEIRDKIKVLCPGLDDEYIVIANDRKIRV